jgi:DNA polymerase III subunit delta'
MQFRDVIGLDEIKSQLVSSVINKKVSHAILFSGQEGRGGLPLAFAFAQFLNCENRSENDSCGNCNSCLKMQKMIHPDVHYSYPVIKKENKPPVSVDFIKQWREAISQNPYIGYFEWLGYMDAENKQGNITIEECHEIIHKFSLKPFEGGNKILIMWLPEFLGKSGNSLLKIIEEPPPDSIFLFVTHNRELILNTILSRTRIIPLPPLQAESIEKKIRTDVGLEAEVATSISILADGNYNEALRLLKTGQSDHTENYIKWMRICYKPDHLEIFNWSKSITENGREYLKDFILYAIRMTRELLLSKNQADTIMRMNETEKEFVTNFSPHISANSLNNFYELANKAHYHIERNASPKIIFFNLSLQLHKLLKKNGK